MVVPDDGPVAHGMGGLQVRIAFVQGIAVTVVLQCAGCAQRLGAGQSFGFFRLGIFIDVVTQKQNHVRCILRDLPPCGVKTVFPALARCYCQAQLASISPHLRSSAGAACGADCIAVHEPVEVPAVGRQSIDLYAHAVAPFGGGRTAAAGNDLAKLLVMRDFPMHLHGRELRRILHAQRFRRRGQSCPDKNVVALGITAGDAQREGVVAQSAAGAGPCRQAACRCGKARGNEKAAALQGGGVFQSGHGGGMNAVCWQYARRSSCFCEHRHGVIYLRVDHHQLALDLARAHALVGGKQLAHGHGAVNDGLDLSLAVPLG